MPRVSASLRFGFVVFVLFLLAACTGAPSPTATTAPTSTPDVAATSAAATDEAVQVAAREEAEVATGIAATLTAEPTATPTETATTEPSATPTKTPKPTNTASPTPAVTATTAATAAPSRTPGPTAAPVTSTPTEAPAGESVYGFTNGIAGYASAIRCTFSGGDCVPVMPPGDISFEFLLGSDATTPLTLFEQYGLSVERDGVNVADMFMFVDAGLLPPDTLVWFGSSRNFNVPGRYVIRSSGCLTTVPAPCGWNTMPGTTVTFTIK